MHSLCQTVLLAALLLSVLPAMAREQQDWEKEWMVKDHTFAALLRQAEKDIAANRDLLLALRQERDESLKVPWNMTLGRALPAQPVAVIDLVAEAADPVAVCAAPFWAEENSDSEAEAWKKRTIAVLQQFEMTDPDKERARRACLRQLTMVPSDMPPPWDSLLPKSRGIDN